MSHDAAPVGSPPQRACPAVHLLVEAVVERTPDATAIVDHQQILSYRELNRRAERLARHLRGLGTGPEMLIGVCLSRSANLIVALLATLKTGAAYLPCDPTYPAERIRMIAEDARIPLLLTERQLAAGLTEAVAAIADGPPLVLCVDELDERSDAAPPPSAQPVEESLAYTIYTSGSTGRPKGVQIVHRGLSNLVDWHQRAFAITPADRAMLVASPAFDASVWEIWPYLTAGASIIIPNEDVRSAPEQLRDWIVAQGISICFLPTPLAEELINLPWPAETRLRTMLTGGDRLTQRPGPKLPFALVNNYGPTEITVVATAGTIAPCAEERLPSIGQAIDGATAHVLDAQLRPLSAGEAGELYIGGRGVARGYLGMPALTAERFVPDPFSPEPGARLYCTGDLVRERQDGRLEFIGRSDHQVKIRGFRIELDEIEAVLAQHPAVRATTVIVREDRPQVRELVAYVVTGAAGGQKLTAELRAFIAARLPVYMVPSAIVALDALPLTTNGKVDRAALPAPERGHHELDAPRTPLEATLVELWEQVLQLDGIGIHDNFFDLGGQSLLAARIVARIGSALHIAITPALIFHHPTIDELSEALLQHEVAERWRAPIEHADRSAPLPLSFAQERLWFMDQLAPETPLYAIPLVISIDGALDRAALERALREIVGRHEALRTVFAEEYGQLAQIILDDCQPPFAELDLRTLEVERREKEIARLTAKHASAPFNLQTGPLLRTMLLRLEDERWQLILNVHHIAFDGWSTRVLLRELGEIYAAYGQGRDNPLAPLPLQYADAADWQRRTLQGQAREHHIDYWCQQLASPPPPLQLPADFPRPSAQSFRGAKVRRRLPAPLLAELEGLSQRAHASLFMTMVAAFQTLLHRYTGQDDLVIGVPTANRARPELEELIGFFVNTLPLRVNLGGNPSFAALLERVRQAALEAYAYQDLPIEQIVEGLEIERDLSHNTLFQVLFVMQNLDLPVVEAAGVRMAFVEEADTGTAKFDLLLFVDLLPDGPVLTIEYSTDLFQRTTVERLLAHYQQLLEGIAVDMRRRIADLPLLTAEERQQLAALDATAADYPREACLHTLFEEQAARTPEAIAVEHGARRLSYAELERRAKQVAHLLRGAGVERDTPVAIYLERSCELAVGVLGALKAGGAYLPLDPAYPADRLALMIDDAQPPVVLTQRSLRNALPQHAARTICLDDCAEIATLPETTPKTQATPDNLAYILYTSGSTGRPKGVAMPHRPIVNLLAWQRRTAALDGPARTLQFSALSFDVSCQEIFFTWATGGTLVLVDDAVRRDMPALLALMDAAEVERIFLPFVALQHLAQAADASDSAPSRLREIITAGEQLQITPQVERLAERLGATLHNQYGPTESHVITALTLSGAPRDWPRLPAIGAPVANGVVRVLDRHGQPVPVGVPGELYLGGVPLARGYYRRPELTAQRFVPDPFAAEPGARLYRTGDLGRLRADGSIEFLGRADDQVKIRGHRVEPGEVEAALAQHADVREAVVVARESGRRGERQLVAYVVRQPSAAMMSEREIVAGYRSFLQDRLPEYMVPAAFVLLEALPLTPSGKVDRRALPAPIIAAETAADAAPRTPLEEVLAGMWAEVLGLPHVGIHDSFFDLGGHSLLATQLTAYIRDALEVEMPLRRLFEAPTVAGLAAALESDPASGPHVAETAQLLLTLAGLSEEDAESMLNEAQLGAH